MMQLDRRAWMIAVAVAVALHAGLAAAMFWPRAEDGAQAPGIGGIEIALGPAGGAPGGDAAEARQAAADEAAPTEPVTDPPQETPELTLPPEPPPPEPAEVERVEIPVDIVEPAPKPQAPVEPAPAEAKPQADVVDSAPSAAGADGKAGAQDSPDAGSHAADASAGGAAGAEADYGAIVLAWLERHKEYPGRAQQRRQEGVVLLFIAVGREGGVLEARIERSSGYDLLDRAALDMVARAAPLPPVPDDMPQERVEMVVPVQFFMT